MPGTTIRPSCCASGPGTSAVLSVIMVTRPMDDPSLPPGPIKPRRDRIRSRALNAPSISMTHEACRLCPKAQEKRPCCENTTQAGGRLRPPEVLVGGTRDRFDRARPLVLVGQFPREHAENDWSGG